MSPPPRSPPQPSSLNFVPGPPTSSVRSHRPRPPSRSPSTTVPSTLPTLLPHPSPVRRPTSSPDPLPTAFESLLSLRLFPSPPAPPPASKRIILWFRSDLRLHDHPALSHALEESGPTGCVIPLYIFDPRRFGPSSTSGFLRTGRHRARFLLDSLTALRAALRHCGSDLLLRVGTPEQVLPSLVDALRVDEVLCHREVDTDDVVVETKVRQLLQLNGVAFCSLWANTLYHVNDLPFAIEDLPENYTHFREAVQRKAQLRDPLPAPRRMSPLPKVQRGELPNLTELGLSEGGEDAAAKRMRGGEEQALLRLDRFVKEAVRGRAACSGEFSGCIAPWLQLGCVSPRRIYREIRDSAGAEARSTIGFELVWRDFFRFVTAKFSRARLLKASEQSAAANFVGMAAT